MEPRALDAEFALTIEKPAEAEPPPAPALAKSGSRKLLVRRKKPSPESAPAPYIEPPSPGQQALLARRIKPGQTIELQTGRRASLRDDAPPDLSPESVAAAKGALRGPKYDASGAPIERSFLGGPLDFEAMSGTRRRPPKLASGKEALRVTVPSLDPVVPMAGGVSHPQLEKLEAAEEAWSATPKGATEKGSKRILNAQESALRRWERQQRTWERQKEHLVHKTGIHPAKVPPPSSPRHPLRPSLHPSRSPRPPPSRAQLGMNAGGAFRQRIEQAELLDAARAMRDAGGARAWEIGLRGGDTYYVPVGHALNGLYCPVPDPAKRAKSFARVRRHHDSAPGQLLSGSASAASLGAASAALGSPYGARPAGLTASASAPVLGARAAAPSSPSKLSASGRASTPKLAAVAEVLDGAAGSPESPLATRRAELAPFIHRLGVPPLTTEPEELLILAAGRRRPRRRRR